MTAAWVARAACANTPTDWFYPDKGRLPQAARQLCDACPVRPECLEHAITNREDGVWGGTTPEQRETIRRKRRRAA